MKSYVLIILGSLMIGVEVCAAAGPLENIFLSLELDVLKSCMEAENHSGALVSAYKALAMFHEDRKDPMKAVIGRLYLARQHEGDHAQAENLFRQVLRSDKASPGVCFDAEKGLRQILAQRIADRYRQSEESSYKEITTCHQDQVKHHKSESAVIIRGQKRFVAWNPQKCSKCGRICQNTTGLAIHQARKHH